MGADGALGRLLERAREDPAVLAVVLFGSAARGEATPASDVDVCLVLTPEADPTRVRLDYLARFDLDVHAFQALPLYVRTRVLREGRVLLVKDEDALYELAARTAKEFADFEPGTGSTSRRSSLDRDRILEGAPGHPRARVGEGGRPDRVRVDPVGARRPRLSWNR